jgi:serine/threonine-protein kinase HipA
MMLFNRAINNTDNHERNFSFMHTGNGYRLAPAYDMVPTLSTGEYPAAGYQYSPQPPLPSEVKSMGKVFGLPKTQVKHIAEEVENAVQQWPIIAEKVGVNNEDIAAVGRVIKW